MGNQLINAAQKPQWVEKGAAALQPAVMNVFEATGKPGARVKNFLHGTWLGHPFHPMLTDIPVGAYSTTAVMDIATLCGNNNYRHVADVSLAVGVTGAAAAAITGAADWTGTSGQNRRIGFVHALLNTGATLLNLTSLLLRKNNNTRKLAIGLSLTAFGITALAGYLGGHLVYGQQMGVDHTAGEGPYPLKFTDALEDAALGEPEMKCVTVQGIPILLVRQAGKIYAIAHTCSHLGGPLSEGELMEDACVKCPWHGSVFSLVDGKVKTGPATQHQPCFETRIRKGMIQVRLALDKEPVKKMDSEDQS